MEVVTLLAEVRERIRSRKHAEEIEVLSAGTRTRPGSPMMSASFTLPLNLPGAADAKPHSPVSNDSPRSEHHSLPSVSPAGRDMLTMVKTKPDYTKQDLEDVKAVFGLSD